MTVGLDLSDSVVRAVVVSDKGDVVARASQPADGPGVPAAIRQVLRKIATAAGRSAGGGIALPWPGDDLPHEMAAAARETFKVPPTTLAPGPAMVLAERWIGAAKSLENVVTFSIGEHVYAGLFVGGQLWRGANGHAGSVGWLALNPVEREDYRRLGGLEAEVGAAGIVRRLIWRIKSGDHSRVVEQVNGDFARLKTEHVLKGARTGDGVCVSVVRDTARYVGMAISNLATVLDPQAIILGGALVSAGDMMLEPIRTECSRRLRPAQSDRINIMLSSLGDDVIAIGAARAAMLNAK
jgi:glucokinase